MRLSVSFFVAVLIFLGLGIWMYSGWEGSTLNSASTAGSTSSDTPADASPKSSQPLLRVKVRDSQAIDHARRFSLFATTEASKVLELRAETDSPVQTVHVKEGDAVEKGAILVTLAEENRPQQLARARAEVAYREAQWKASEALSKKQFSAKVNLARDAAALADARAVLSLAELEMNRLRSTTPLKAVVEDILFVPGQYVRKGDILARLYALDPLIVKTNVSETLIHHVRYGQQVGVLLPDNTRYSGTISQIAASADAKTRTFAVEVQIPNPDNRLRGGMTATVEIIDAKEKVHFVSSALLTLNDVGQMGLKVVDEENRVRFYEVDMNDENEQGMFVAGLPERARIIVLGQEYVEDGQEVIAVSP